MIQKQRGCKSSRSDDDADAAFDQPPQRRKQRHSSVDGLENEVQRDQQHDRRYQGEQIAGNANLKKLSGPRNINCSLHRIAGHDQSAAHIELCKIRCNRCEQVNEPCGSGSFLQ